MSNRERQALAADANGVLRGLIAQHAFAVDLAMSCPRDCTTEIRSTFAPPSRFVGLGWQLESESQRAQKQFVAIIFGGDG